MKTTPNKAASRQSIGGILVILVAYFILETSAKRGCSAFGHSCFGGHGKRSDSPVHRAEAGVQENDANGDARENFEAVGVGGEVLLADVGQIYQDRPMPRFQSLQFFTPQHQYPRYNLPPFLRQLLTSYHLGNTAEFE